MFGGTAEAGAWTSLFGAVGEYFYHSNLKTPRWLGLLIQRPEHHSVHHQLGVHSFNFGDLTVWDRLFGTFRDTDEFAARCGFPGRQEEKLGAMLCFRDVYDERALPTPAVTLSNQVDPLRPGDRGDTAAQVQSSLGRAWPDAMRRFCG